MGRHNFGFVRYVQLIKYSGGVLHRRPVRLATHHNADGYWTVIRILRVDSLRSVYLPGSAHPHRRCFSSPDRMGGGRHVRTVINPCGMMRLHSGALRMPLRRDRLMLRAAPNRMRIRALTGGDSDWNGDIGRPSDDCSELHRASDQRREWDSNPRRLAPHGFSRAAHLSALPSLRASARVLAGTGRNGEHQGLAGVSTSRRRPSTHSPALRVDSSAWRRMAGAAGPAAG